MPPLGPVRSTFGLHLVQLSARTEGHAPPLEQVRAQVERDLLRAKAEQENAAIYTRLRANYKVQVEAGAAAKPAS